MLKQLTLLRKRVTLQVTKESMYAYAHMHVRDLRAIKDD